MKDKQWYLCKIKPLEEYFFGGEKNFGFGDDTKEKNDYFISSEEIPNQSTLLGMLRFMILKKEGQLNEGWKVTAEQREIQNSLIGPAGFSLQELDKVKDYGRLEQLSPLFLVDRRKNRYIKTPYNHQKGKETKSYTPFAVHTGTYTEYGYSVLPVGYDAKKGLEDSYMNLDDACNALIDKTDIFGSMEHTRISKTSTEDGFFKKEYKNLNDQFSFGFYVLADKESLPSEDIVYLGQDKSTFAVEVQEVLETEVDDFYQKVHTLPISMGCENMNVYYTLADTLIEIDDEMKDIIKYSILEKKLYRSLGTVSGKETFKDSRKKSNLYQLVRPGSVFYVPVNKENDFERKYEYPMMRQAGFNYIMKMGGQV